MTTGKQANQRPWLWGTIFLVILIVTIGLIVYFKLSRPPVNSNGTVSTPTNSSAVATTPKPLTLLVEGVTVESRGSDPGNSKNVVVTATVEGHFELKDPKPETLGILAFWRVPSSSFNWYMTTTKVNGQVEPAVLDGAAAVAKTWNYEIGGISVDKTYQGTIIMVLVAYPKDLITKNQQSWLDQNNDKGFAEIPELQAKADSSAPATFNCAYPVK